MLKSSDVAELILCSCAPSCVSLSADWLAPYHGSDDVNNSLLSCTDDKKIPLFFFIHFVQCA